MLSVVQIILMLVTKISLLILFLSQVNIKKFGSCSSSRKVLHEWLAIL